MKGDTILDKILVWAVAIALCSLALLIVTLAALLTFTAFDVIDAEWMRRTTTVVVR